MAGAGVAGCTSSAFGLAAGSFCLALLHAVGALKMHRRARSFSIASSRLALASPEAFRACSSAAAGAALGALLASAFSVGAAAPAAGLKMHRRCLAPTSAPSRCSLAMARARSARSCAERPALIHASRSACGGQAAAPRRHCERGSAAGGCACAMQASSRCLSMAACSRRAMPLPAMLRISGAVLPSRRETEALRERLRVSTRSSGAMGTVRGILDTRELTLPRVGSGTSASHSVVEFS
mmetsp:Transcript_135/g.461  ORF Transcript_135/g.461 Transcript_135/m.461 type:complete len:239 (-) Transcript_135:1065-1781(-)